jgi:D-alanyl-D-alanine carboxypeptidase/D-alanyl-D-alanine-endopeptidase (penicillin-binding protein 4)
MQFLSDDGVRVGSAAQGPLPPNGPFDIEDGSAAPAPPEQHYPDSHAVWIHESPTVAQLIARMMPPSDNFIAEHLFKLLPVVALHQRGTFDGAAAVERKFIASLGLDPRTIDNGDGSGLSQGDRITPHDLASILAWETHSSTGHQYIGALAIAGVNGTVHRHLHGSDAIGRVRAKDGYIWHVSTFSGYARTYRHGTIVFSVMFNEADGSLRPFYTAEDQIVESIVDWR